MSFSKKEQNTTGLVVFRVVCSRGLRGVKKEHCSPLQISHNEDHALHIYCLFTYLKLKCSNSIGFESVGEQLQV